MESDIKNELEVRLIEEKIITNEGENVKYGVELKIYPIRFEGYFRKATLVDCKTEEEALKSLRDYVVDIFPDNPPKIRKYEILERITKKGIKGIGKNKYPNVDKKSLLEGFILECYHRIN